MERLSHMESGSRSSACRSIRRDGTVVSPSEDGLRRRGTRRDCKGDVETQNILRIFSETAQSGRIHVIRGIEPLVQVTELEQPDSSSVIQSRGAVRNITHKVLGILQEYDLFLRPQKCEFEKREIAYLGLVICPGEVLMDPGKVDAIR